MTQYEGSRFSPPAPLARVVLRNPSSGAARTDVPMLLDTGADVTLIQRAFVEQLGVSPDPNESYELVGFNGTVSNAHVVLLHLKFLGRTFRGRFPLTDDSFGILGRNVLNCLSLVFDGPRLEWREELESR